MRLFSIVFMLMTLCGFLQAQNVGIGTINPIARLHVADSSVVFTAPLALPSPAGLPPISGQGTRMMWYPAKAAFRVGSVVSNSWDKDNIGNYSFAAGYNTTAKGDYSFAMGYTSQANALESVAIGSSRADGVGSVAVGRDARANGAHSFAIGYSSSAQGLRSYAIGPLCFAGGENATALGYNALAYGNSSAVVGLGTVTKAFASISIGPYNDGSDNPDPANPGENDRLFQLGNGTSQVRNNAITVLRSGNTGIGNVDPSYRLDVNGRMRIRSGGSAATSAGMFFNNTANTSVTGFVGLADDTHVGFWGESSDFAFTMNTQTGALKINGSEGYPGYLLESNGASAPPNWRSNPVNDMHNLTEEISATDRIFLTAPNSADVPGLTKTIVLTKISKVIVQFMVYARTSTCTFCGRTTFNLYFSLNAQQTGLIWELLENGTSQHVTGTRIFTLLPGTHVIKVAAQNFSGPELELGTVPGSLNASFLTIQVIPYN